MTDKLLQFFNWIEHPVTVGQIPGSRQLEMNVVSAASA
jgi:hypothetical protein